MVKVKLTNEILNDIITIEKRKTNLSSIVIPLSLSNTLRKNSQKHSSYASNKIEGNPLTYSQAEKAIEAKNRHLLKPEQEIVNYFNAIEYLSHKLKNNVPISLKLILDVQKIIVKGESKDKIGIRNKMPPGVLFAVYDTKTHQPEYIPPEYKDIIPLLTELIDYINTADDHPIIKSAVLHYQLVTIHPFEDGNGRTARIIANYLLGLYGYNFRNIGSIEEYFNYNLDEYYSSLQMNLPINYYDGRNNPPHFEIWINYYLKVMKLYSARVLEIATNSVKTLDRQRQSHLSKKALFFLKYLKTKRYSTFSPIDVSKELHTTNRTIINWCIELVNNGYLKPHLVNKRIRKYSLIEKDR